MWLEFEHCYIPSIQSMVCTFMISNDSSWAFPMKHAGLEAVALGIQLELSHPAGTGSRNTDSPPPPHTHTHVAAI